MVAVHVGDEDPSQLRKPQVAAQKLMLSALSAIEQPEFRTLSKPHCHR